MSDGFIGSSIIMTLPPRPVIVPSTDDVYRPSRAVVLKSAGVERFLEMTVRGNIRRYHSYSITILLSRANFSDSSVEYEALTMCSRGLCPNSHVEWAIFTTMDFRLRGGTLIIKRFISPQRVTSSIASRSIATGFTVGCRFRSSLPAPNAFAPA